MRSPDVRLRQPAGTDPDAVAVPLSYLHHRHLAPPALRPRRTRRALRRHVPADGGQVDSARALAALPPLIKGYLRLGGFSATVP